MDFSGDRVESTTRLHYWENTAPEFRLGLATFSLFIYFFNVLFLLWHLL